MAALAAKLDPGFELRAFDPSMPLRSQVGDIDVLLLGSFRVGAEIIDAAPKLRLIQQHGRGVDPVDRAAAAKSGVCVANVPGGNNIAVAEFTLALMLSMAKRFHDMPAAIAASLTGTPPGIEIYGKTLGIVGLGGAGLELAKRAKCLGMQVLASRANPSAGAEIPLDFIGGPGDLPQILARSDFVCLLATLTEATRGMIGGAQIDCMKPAAYLINTARGPLVDYGALFTALKTRRIAGAAFDTFWSEPADPADPILQLPNFVLTPHVAGFSDSSIDHVTGAVCENLRRLRDGVPLLNLVGP
jgi:D-3-phosphoglycerate dehydrogenase